MKKYLIDFDGVVLDSQAKFDEVMNGNKNFFDWEKYLNSINWHEFYKSCNEIDDAFSTLYKLQMTDRLMGILTTIHSFDEGREKTTILRLNKIEVPVIFVLPHQSKSIVFPPIPNVPLVDDKSENCHEYEKHGGEALVFKPDSLKKSKKIVKSLKELL